MCGVSGHLTITADDLRSLVTLLDPERPGDADEELPASFVADLAELVPCSYASFILIDARRDVSHVQSVDVASVDPFSSMAPDVQEELHRLFSEAYWAEGGCSYVEDTGDRSSVLRTSDLISSRDFSRTLMGALCHQVGIRHEVMVSLPPLGTMERRLILFRDEGSDFSDREVLLLTMLRPHLFAAHLRQRRRRHGIPRLTPRQWEILRLVATGRSNAQIARSLGLREATVGKHLENVYGRLDVGSRTAALAKVAPVIHAAGR